MWNVGLSIGSKVIGVAGTLVIARYIAPEVYGEVLAAIAVAVLANVATRFGLGQYLIVNSEPGDDISFHTTFYWVVLGIVGFGVTLLFTDTFARWFNAPNLDRYLLGVVVAIAIRRISAIPERILTRDMKFRSVAIGTAIGELSYALSAVLLAMRGFGGDAVVIGNIIQSCVVLVLLSLASGWREWLIPVRIRWERTRDMFRYGTPLNFQILASQASRRVDNLLIANLFGTGTLAKYNYAYSLADIPATHVGETIATVLLPSMAKTPPEQRISMLIRSTALLALLIFPMAVGLGVVAEPLIDVVFNEEWQGVAPFLTALAALSVFRPLSWASSIYFQTVDRTPLLMIVAVLRLVLVLGFIYLFSFWGPVWACLGVGLAYGITSLVMIIFVSVLDHVPMSRFGPGFFGPLLACVPLAGAAIGVDHGLSAIGIESSAISLICQIAAGAIVYVPSAFIFAPGIARDFIGLLRKALQRRRPAAKPKAD